MPLVLTKEEQLELYRLADGEEEALAAECKRRGIRPLSRRRRHLAADAIKRAFDAEIDEYPMRKPSIASIRRRVRGDEQCGIIGTILVMIFVQVVARLIVAWLIELWRNRRSEEPGAAGAPIAG